MKKEELPEFADIVYEFSYRHIEANPRFLTKEDIVKVMKMPGESKLDMAFSVLSKKIGSSGFWGLIAGAALRVLISYAVAELNSRFGHDWEEGIIVKN